MKRAVRGGLLGLIAASLLLSGCVGLPDHGPVVERNSVGRDNARKAFDITARPPAPGASRLEVVTGFLDAMTAWPIQTPVAKQYLTADAAGEWNPEVSTIIYSDVSPPRESGSDVQVTLTGADRLDGSGTWRGKLPAKEREITFQTTFEDGEFRITAPPDALIVPATWFQARYRQVALYYFDPSAQILVPEPAFLRVGDQLATTLVSALVAGPPRRLRDVVRSFLPAEVSIGLSVPVSDTGVAAVDLVGEVPRPSPEEAELLVAQLAWTLRQDPDITAFQVKLGGQEVRLSAGQSVFPVDSGPHFDPAGYNSSGLLFGIRGGHLIRGAPEGLAPVDGAFGTGRYQFDSVGVAPSGRIAAGVTDDGTRAVVSSIRGDTSDAVTTALSGAQDLARPTWDYAERLWLLDRRASGAVIWSLVEGRARAIRVPGITGESVRQILVSRDGTRLLAIVRHKGGDRVLGARIVLGPRGRVARAVEPFAVDDSMDGRRIIDIAWSTSTRVATLTPARPGSLFEVDIVPADGAEVGVDTLSTVVSGRVIGLAGGDGDQRPTYAVLPDSLVDVRTREVVGLSGKVRQLDYVG